MQSMLSQCSFLQVLLYNITFQHQKTSFLFSVTRLLEWPPEKSRTRTAAPPFSFSDKLIFLCVYRRAGRCLDEARETGKKELVNLKSKKGADIGKKWRGKTHHLGNLIWLAEIKSVSSDYQKKISRRKNNKTNQKPKSEALQLFIPSQT